MKLIADIRHWQGDINWNLAREELSMCIFRATKDKEQDPRYLQYTSECGLPYGAYCYLHASNAVEAREEARAFVAVANRAHPLFYIGDIEHDNQTIENTEEVCFAFLHELTLLRCSRIGLYINTLYPYCGAALNLCDIIWIPHWGLNDGTIPADEYKSPYYCDLWQYTSNGRISGINTKMDLNILSGNKSFEWFTTDTTSKLGTRLLKLGSKGKDVLELQQLLNNLLDQNLILDGEYGSATKKVVELFQQKYNLSKDGLYGKLSHAKLVEEWSNKQRAQKITFPSFTVTPWTASVYSGCGEKYEKIFTLHRAFRVCPIFTSNYTPLISNDYMAINCGNTIGWIHMNNLIEVNKHGSHND